jgi:hypothetical protein
MVAEPGIFASRTHGLHFLENGLTGDNRKPISIKVAASIARNVTRTVSVGKQRARPHAFVESRSGFLTDGHISKRSVN